MAALKNDTESLKKKLLGADKLSAILYQSTLAAFNSTIKAASAIFN